MQIYILFIAHKGSTEIKRLKLVSDGLFSSQNMGMQKFSGAI